MTPRMTVGNFQMQKLQAITRRHLLGRASIGIGAMALGSMLGMNRARGASMPGGDGPMAPKQPQRPARIKHVIYLHMAGAPSQLDLFEHKPELNKLHLQPCPQSLLEGRRFAFIKGVPNMLGTPFKFQRHGEAGQWISELLPNFASVVDKACVVRSMHTDQFNHSPAQLLVQTGNPRLGHPSIGSWVTYGLGSESQNLPGFVVLVSGGKTPDAGKSLWGSGFLPTVYQGVQCRNTGDPVLYLSNPPGMDRTLRRTTLDALRDLNEYQLQHVGDPETVTRIAQYEMAYRMQMAVPEVMDISREPQHVLDLYGARPGHVSTDVETATDPRTFYKATDPTFANNCLLARRLVEQGVRFVQVYDWGWDHHGSSPGESIDQTLPIKCGQIDRAVTGLIVDLEQRGLLDETLIVWSGEFGRTPMMQNNVRTELKPGFWGRDHHSEAFTVWLAGGGIKPGLAFGATDDIGYYITEGRSSIHDLQATILHLLGMDPYRFSYMHQGLNERLIGPTDEPDIMKGILA